MTSDRARRTVFRVVLLLAAGSWLWWGGEVLRGQAAGPGAIAAWVTLGAFLLVLPWSAEARRSEGRLAGWALAHAWVDALRWAVWLTWLAYIAWAFVDDGVDWTVMLRLAFASATLGVVEPLVARRVAPTDQDRKEPAAPIR